MRAVEVQPGSATAVSREKLHAGSTRWGYRLHIGSRRVTGGIDREQGARVARASYNEDGLASCEMELYGDFRAMRGHTVRAFCGYGSPRGYSEWFTGRLGKGAYSGYEDVTKVTAYGPSHALGRQYFDEPVRFQGFTLAGFWNEVMRRLHDPEARLEIVGASQLELQPEESDEGETPASIIAFGGETSLEEAGSSVNESLGYIHADVRGYGLSVKPEPRPGGLERAKAVFNASDLPPKQPEMEPSEEGPYAKVVVLRVAEDGTEVVRAEARVVTREGAPPKPNEIYWLTEYKGNQLEAQREAFRLARLLEVNVFAGTVEGVSANPDLHQYEGVILRIDEAEGRRIYRRDYEALVGEIDIDLIAGQMGFGFEALRGAERDVTPRTKAGGRSPYVIRTEGVG